MRLDGDLGMGLALALCPNFEVLGVGSWNIRTSPRRLEEPPFDDIIGDLNCERAAVEAMISFRVTPMFISSAESESTSSHRDCWELDVKGAERCDRA